jgi:Fe-S-cluster containining protein
MNDIPPQRLASWIRWPVRIIAWPFVLLDLQMQRLARMIIRPPLRQEGHCLKRGSCCQTILIEYRPGLLGKLWLFWNTEVLGFYPKKSELHQEDGKAVFVMGCRYLRKDGTCAHYRLRPAVCRKWPLIEYFRKQEGKKGASVDTPLSD